MKLLKRALIFLGVVFILVIALVIFLASASSDFEKQHEQFVRNFTADFSLNWEIDSVKHHLTNDMLAQIGTPNGRHALNVFRSFGQLEEISDMELSNYNSNTSGLVTGIFKFKARFKNGSALVTVTLHEKDDAIRVHGFHIDPVGNLSNPKEINT